MNNNTFNQINGKRSSKLSNEYQKSPTEIDQNKSLVKSIVHISINSDKDSDVGAQSDN